MIGVEVGFVLLELAFIADKNDRFARHLIVSVSLVTAIVVRQICNDECLSSDCNAHNVINNFCLRNAENIDKSVADTFSHLFHKVHNKVIQIIFAELHGNEAVISFKLAALFCLILFPLGKGEVNLLKCPAHQHVFGRLPHLLE